MELLASLAAAGLSPGAMVGLGAAVWVYRDIRTELHGIRSALQTHVVDTTGRIARLEARQEGG